MQLSQSAIVLLRSADDRFLLQLRDNKTKASPEHWSFFGGGIDAGETPEEAAIREIFEEVGYMLGSVSFIMEFNWRMKGHRTYLFYADILAGIETLSLNEGYDCSFFSVEEIAGGTLLSHKLDEVFPVAHSIPFYIEAYKHWNQR